MLCFNNNLNLYNIVFDFDYEAAYDSFLGTNTSNIINLYNCTSIKNPVLLRCTHGSTHLINCYGNFRNGYLTNQAQWDYKTNCITLEPKINSTTYQITATENTWKDVGTGTDLDGSQADLGVYGGTYSWEYETDIN